MSKKTLVFAMEFSTDLPPSARRATGFGGYSGGVTPVPIPNTEVKPASADGTWVDSPWESRTPPDFDVERAWQSPGPLPVLAFAGRVAWHVVPNASRPPSRGRGASNVGRSSAGRAPSPSGGWSAKDEDRGRGAGAAEVAGSTAAAAVPETLAARVVEGVRGPPSAAGRGPSGYRRSEAEDLRAPSGRSASPPRRTGTAGRSGDSRWSDDRDGPRPPSGGGARRPGPPGAGRGSWLTARVRRVPTTAVPVGGGQGPRGRRRRSLRRPRPVPPVTSCAAPMRPGRSAALTAALELQAARRASLVVGTVDRPPAGPRAVVGRATALRMLLVVERVGPGAGVTTPATVLGLVKAPAGADRSRRAPGRGRLQGSGSNPGSWRAGDAPGRRGEAGDDRQAARGAWRDGGQGRGGAAGQARTDRALVRGGQAPGGGSSVRRSSDEHGPASAPWRGRGPVETGRRGVAATHAETGRRGVWQPGWRPPTVAWA